MSQGRAERGFTLVELVVILVIIGILMAIALPAFISGHVDRAHDSEALQYATDSYHVGKTVWRHGQSYLPQGLAGDTSSSGSLIGKLSASEPELSFSHFAVSSTDPHVVFTRAPMADVALYATRSRSGKVFCVETIERNLGAGYSAQPGLYFSQGYGTAACGMPQTTTYLAGTVTPQQTPTAGGSTTQPLPIPALLGDDAKSPFQPAIVALRGISVVNSADANGVMIGSNGQVSVGNSSTVGDISLGVGTSYPNVGGGGTTTGSITCRTAADGPWVLAPVDIGQIQTNNAALSSIPGVSYDASTRAMSFTGSTLTLPSGVYSFCSLSFGNNVNIVIPSSAQVKIVMDSPDRPGSTCPSGSGGIAMGNHVEWLNQGDASHLALFVYGLNDGSQRIDFRNQSSFIGGIYAPRSYIYFNNSGQVDGGIAAQQVGFKNSMDFTWDPDLGDITQPIDW